MKRKLALLTIAFCLAVLLSGCGSSQAPHDPPLVVTTSTVPQGVINVPYSVTLSATGGAPPYAWNVASGSVPPGLTLNRAGVLSGTPTDAGTSSFKVQASDSETPPATATASLSIVITPPPARNAALYVSKIQASGDQTGLHIQSDGSLTLLPSSPESAIDGSSFAPSPTLPLLFMAGGGANGLESLLVNPDYSLASYSSSGRLPGSGHGTYGPPSVDPTGSNVYLPGPIDSNDTPGLTIFPGNGSMQPLSTIALGAPSSTILSRMAFTPDGTLAFISACNVSPPPPTSNILAFSRSSDGTLTNTTNHETFRPCAYTNSLTVSPDGRYLATGEVQVYSIASDGTLTAVLPQLFTVTLAGGGPVTVNDLTWDSSGAYLVAATANDDPLVPLGGVAVLQFSGSTLTESVFPTGGPVGRLQWAGSSVYAMGLCPHTCPATGILGLDFNNGQLTPLPGSPYPYGNGGDMVIY
jgi:Putative Ig domain